MSHPAARRGLGGAPFHLGLDLALVVGWAVVVGWAAEADLYVALATYSAFVVLTILFRAGGDLRARFRLDLGVLAWGLGGALVLILLTHGAYAALARLFPPLSAAVSEQYATRGPGQNEQRLGLMLLVILAEELLWRGRWLESLSAAGWPRLAPWISLLSYVLVQLPLGTGVIVLLAAGCGAFWTLQRVFSQSVMAPLITHVAWNLVLLVFWPVRPP